MKNTTKMIVVCSTVALLSAALAGAAVWHFGAAPQPAATAAAPQEESAKKPAKYVTLDKVIVMLRRAPGEAQAHYISADLVLAATAETEKQAKEHLPLLRSIAVRSLSSYTMSAASAMTVEQYAAQLNRTFDASYAADKVDKPFSEVMIGKLIIE
jgi:flagellar FliL protein